MLTKRVEVLFDPEDYRAIEELARSLGQTVGSMVCNGNTFASARSIGGRRSNASSAGRRQTWVRGRRPRPL